MQKDVTEENRKHSRWRVTDAKVNIAALLNDPRKVRRDYDLFTKTWGEGFRDAPARSSIPEHYPLPRITWNSFANYLGQTRDKFLRHQSQILPTDQERNATELEESPRWLKDGSGNRSFLQQSSSRSIAGQHQDDIKAAARTALSNVPKIFLVPSFHLEDESTFLSVLNLNEKQHKNHRRDSAIHISSSKLLQEKLSHYLDIVEVAIVRQISARSDAFFNEMVSQENLNEHLAKLSAQVHCMREKMAVTKTQMSHKLCQVIHLRSKLKNKEALLEALHIMASVHQAQPTIQLLLSTNEYSGAFDLIETTQQVLKQELAGIHCFRHLSSQLSEIEKVIGHMMKDELSRCIQSELQRPLNEGYATVNPNHLISIALGLLRRRQLVFLEEFHEGIKVSVKTAIKMTVMDAVTMVEGHTSESDTDNPQNQVNGAEMANSPQKVGTLADKMRQLEFQVWIEMLKNVFENMNIFLRRIKSFLTVIVAAAQMSSSPNNDSLDTDNDISELGSCCENGIASPSKDATGDAMNHIHDENGDVIDDMDQYEMRLMEAARSESAVHGDEMNPTYADRKPDAKISSPPVNTAEESSDASDPNQFLSKKEHDDMMLLVCHSLLRAADFSHDRCAKLIIAKNKNSSLDKLGSKEFLSYLQVAKQYVSDTELILFDIFEESNSFISDERYFSEYLKSNFGNAIESNSPLRGVLKSHKSLYIGRFHEERRNKLSLIIDNENWKQAEVPLEISNMFQEIFVMNRIDSVKSQNGDPAISSLTIDRIQFSVVGTVLLLFKMVADYIRCANDLPNSVPDLASRVSELLTFFNSRTCQLVLGAGALKTVGLKTISTKNLGLASRCLQLVLHLLPSVRYIFETMMEAQASNMLPKTQQKGLRCFDHVAKAYQDHVTEIDSKLVSILDCVIEACFSKWQVKAPMPSREIRTICRQISKFHETICDLLPGQQIQKILLATHQNFQNRLRMKLKQYDVKNDGGPKFGLVMSDVAFYQKAILSLGVLLDDDLTIEAVWR